MNTWIKFSALVWMACIGVAQGQGLRTTPLTRDLLTNATAGQFRTNIGAIGLPELTNANVLYVQTAGNNATAVKGNSGRPWASISNAFAAVANGDTVLISPGDYANHKGWVAHQAGTAALKLFNLTNVTIKGFGRGTRIGFTNYGTCIWMSNCNNVKIEDVYLYSLAPTGPGINFAVTNLFGAIEVEKSTNCFFERNWLVDHGDHGIWNYQKGGASFKSFNCTVRDNVFINLGSWGSGDIRYDGAAVVPGPGWVVEDNHIYDCAFGVEAFAEYGEFTPVRILNNHIYNSLYAPIAYAGEATLGAAHGWFIGGEVSGNYIYHTPGYTRNGSNSIAAYAIQVQNSSNVVVRGNQVINAPNDGITIRNGGAFNITQVLVEDNFIWRATIRGIHLFSDTAGKTVNNSTIRGNHISENGRQAIEFSGTNNIVEDNIIHNWCISNPGGPGIDPAIMVVAGNGNSNSIVRNNRIYDDQVTRTGGIGIQVASGVQKVRLAGNIVEGGLGAIFENNAGSELIYDDYGKSLGGTNLAGNLLVTNNVQLAARTANSILRVDANKNVADITIGTNLIFDGTTLSASAGGAGASVAGPISAVQFQSNGVFGGSSAFVFNNTNGNVGIGTTIPLAPIQVGNGTLENSSDSQILISRAVDSTVGGNGHAFSDSSIIDRPGGVSYNSYDARIILTNAQSYGHYAGFQSGPTFSGSGTIDNIYNFYALPAITAGSVANNYGLFVQNPGVTGGNLTNNYAIYIVNQTVGSALNYALYHAGTNRFYSMGPYIGSRFLSSPSAVGVATKQMEVQSSDGTEAALRLSQAGQNFWDISSVAGTTRFSIGDVGGALVTILNGGNVGIGTVTPLAKLHVVGTIAITNGDVTVGDVWTVTNANGMGTWSLPTTPVAGPIGSVQFNSNGVAGGSSLFVFNPTNGHASIGTSSPDANNKFQVDSSSGRAGRFNETRATAFTASGIWASATGIGAAGNIGGLFQATGGDANYAVYIDEPSTTAANDYAIYSTAAAKSRISGKLVLGLGGSNPTNQLDVGGSVGIGAGYGSTVRAPQNGLIVEGQTVLNGLALVVSPIVGSTTLTTNDCVVLADSTAGTIIVTLPDITPVREGALFRIKNVGSGSVIVTNFTTGQTIDLGTTGTTLTTMQSVDLHKQGTAWWKF